MELRYFTLVPALWTLEAAIDALDNGLKFFSDLNAASQTEQGFQKVVSALALNFLAPRFNLTCKAPSP